MRKEYSTKSRNLMMQYIQEHAGQQFSAAEINEYLQEKECQINLATIYRNLDKLSEDGILMRYKFADQKCFLYQYSGVSEQCQHHLHMKCEKCGKILHLECGLMHEISTHLMEHHGFAIDCKTSMIMGLCQDCRKKDSNRI